jgi:GGDEF domain-containing protein
MQYSLDTTSKPATQNDGLLSDLLCLLIENIGKHAVEEKQEELQRYQQRLRTEMERLRAASEQSELRGIVQKVIDLMAKQNEAVKSDYKMHTSELGKALRLMVETIAEVSKSSEAGGHQLTAIEKNLEEATAIGNATNFRWKLAACLKKIREHSEITRVESEQRLSHLKTFVASAPAALQAAVNFEEPIDKVTGLPTRAFAENLINERLARNDDCLVGVIAMNRFKALKENFGPVVTDDLVKTVAQRLLQLLPKPTELCRWSANSFVAITDIVSSYAETALQWRSVRGLKVEKQIEDPTRTALVSLNTNLMVEHLRPSSSKRVFVQEVDRFVEQNA